MKARREESNRLNVMHLWTRDEVARAVPYLRSIAGSLREHWLDMHRAQRDMDRLAKDVSQPGTQRLVKEKGILDERDRARGRFEDALNELHGMEAYLIDPVQGTAVMPFRKDDDLAWYVFDYFAPPGVIGWRYQNDPVDACRPLDLLEEVKV